MSTSPSRLVTKSGIHVSLYPTVRADAPWIVCCHGYAMTQDFWRNWIPTLTTRYRVATFDLPGYGLSPITLEAAAARQIDDWPGYLEDVISALGAERCLLVASHTGTAASL